MYFIAKPLALGFAMSVLESYRPRFARLVGSRAALRLSCMCFRRGKAVPKTDLKRRQSRAENGFKLALSHPVGQDRRVPPKTRPSAGAP